MPKEIAEAFGLHPNSLEAVEHDEHVAKAEQCRLCADWERKFSELAAELAECRKEMERYRNQVQSLLMAASLNRQ